MLAKLINGQISFAPQKLYVNGRLVTNPSDSLLESLGYQQVIESEMPNEAVPEMCQAMWIYPIVVLLQSLLLIIMVFRLLRQIYLQAVKLLQ